MTRSSNQDSGSNIHRLVRAGLIVGVMNGLFAAAMNAWTHNPFLGSWYYASDLFLARLGRVAPGAVAIGMGTSAGLFTLFVVLGGMIGIITGLILVPIGGKHPSNRWIVRVHVGLAVVQTVFIYGTIAVFDIGFSHAEVTGLAQRLIAGVAGIAIVMGFVSTRCIGPRCERLPVGGLRKPLLVFFMMFLPGILAVQGEASRRRSDDAPALPAQGRVLLLGIDGLERNLVMEGIEAGRMPNFASLLEKGTMGPLRTIIPYYSPVVWTSVATGRRPMDHGITGFVDAETHDADLLDRRDVKAAALWDILASRNLSGGFVNWYYTWPAVAPGPGYMVSDRLVYPGLELRVMPSELMAPVDSVVAASVDAFPMDQFVNHEFDPDFERLPKISVEYERHRFHKTFRRSIHRDVSAVRSAVACEAARDEPADLLAVYIRATDASGHIYWKNRVARDHPAVGQMLWGVGPEDAANFGDAIDRYYATVDQLLGELLTWVDDRTTVIIASDHGYGFNLSGGRAVKFDNLLKALGFLERTGNLAEIDWERTRFFDNPNNLRIDSRRRLSANLQGREPQGTVSPEENQRDAPILRDRLAGLATTEGVPVFRSVEISELEGGLDVVADLNSDLELDATVDLGDGDSLPVWEIALNFRISGMHRMDATLLLSGRGIDPSASTRAAGILDIAPTVLHLLGQPVGRDMDGRVLAELLQGEPAERDPSFVDSFDDVRIRPDGSATDDAAVDEVIKRQLRTLGYIQ